MGNVTTAFRRWDLAWKIGFPVVTAAILTTAWVAYGSPRLFFKSMAEVAPSDADTVVSGTIGAASTLLGTVISSTLAFVFGLVLATYGGRLGRREDWKLVFDLFDRIHGHEMASKAVLLLDYDAYQVTFPVGGEPNTVRLWVTRKDVHRCLRVDAADLEFTEVEKHLRDCFDCLFVELTKICIILENGGIKMREVDKIFGFFFARVRCEEEDWEVFRAYLNGFFYDSVLALIEAHWEIYSHKYSGKKRPLIKDRVFPPGTPFGAYSQQLKTSAGS